MPATQRKRTGSIATLRFPSRPRFVLVGHPRHNRVLAFQAALAQFDLPPAEIVAWTDLAAGRDCLERALSPNCVVRLESPGQHAEVEKQLISIGAGIPETEHPKANLISAMAALELQPEKGRLWYPRQWFRGFHELLRQLAVASRACPTVRWMNPPLEAARMFDKPLCASRLAAAGISMPTALGSISCFDELLEKLRELERPWVFVKLACGSSASGTVALAVHRTGLRATTTIEMASGPDCMRLYNSRRIRTYRDPRAVRNLIDWLCREGVHVEAWLPKETLGGQAFDLRVVVIGGRTCHTVARCSKSPMTNLHLLNARGDVDAARSKVGDDRWEAAMTSCRATAAAFPNTLYAGVDVLFVARSRRHAVLEINAFGDLLPGVIHNGYNTYAAELRSLLIEGAACTI